MGVEELEQDRLVRRNSQRAVFWTGQVSDIGYAFDLRWQSYLHKDSQESAKSPRSKTFRKIE